MNFIYISLLFCLPLFADEYYAKVEPYELREIASNVSGKVLYTNENMLGRKLSKEPYIKIDTQLDKDELEIIKEKLDLYRKILKNNQNVLQNLKKTLQLKQKNYNGIKSLKIKSQIEKDIEYYDLINSENNYINMKKEINNLKLKIADLELQKKQLYKTIKDKNLSAKGYVLYALKVKEGNVVNPSTPLAIIADTSKAILTIYIDEEDIKDLDKKKIYINGKKTDYKVDRIIKIADSKNVSKYKAQIIIKAPELFSKLVKIEIKEG